MSGKSEQFNTRLDPDDAAAVKEYADEHGVTKSEATRRFIRAGREVIDEDEADEDEAERETRTIRTGQHLNSLAQLIQIALTLAVFVIVAGGAP